MLDGYALANLPACCCAFCRDRGMKVGLSLRPGTPVESLFQYMHLLDVVLVMTVEPGFGGQKFMPEYVAVFK